MMIPKRVLINIKRRLSVMTDQQLQEMFDFQKSKLNKINQTESAENAKYLGYSVEQKITLIENELKHRENLNQI